MHTCFILVGTAGANIVMRWFIYSTKYNCDFPCRNSLSGNLLCYTLVRSSHLWSWSHLKTLGGNQRWAILKAWSGDCLWLLLRENVRCRSYRIVSCNKISQLNIFNLFFKKQIYIYILLNQKERGFICIWKLKEGERSKEKIPDQNLFKSCLI